MTLTATIGQLAVSRALPVKDCRSFCGRMVLLLLSLLGLGASPAFAVDITFNYESGVTGFDTQDVRQTLSGETLKAVSVSDAMAGRDTTGGIPVAGTESLFTAANANNETSVTFSLVSGVQFDLAAITFGEYGNSNETITLTSSKGSVSYGLNALASGTFNVAGHVNAANMQGITSFTVTVTGSFWVIFDNIALQQITSSTSPTLIATGTNPTFTEGGSAVDLYGSVTANTNDSGQTFTGMTLTLSNVSNSASEILTIGGTSIALNNTNSGTLAVGGNFSVSNPVGTATVALTGMARSNAELGTLIDGMTYQNTHDNPGNSSRVVTITGITDDGGSNNSATPNLASTVSVAPVNDVPAISGLPASLSFTEDTQANFDISASAFSDADSTNVTVVLTASAGTFGLANTGITLTALGGQGTATITVGGIVANVNQYFDTGSNITYTPAANAHGSPAATVTITANDGNGSGNVVVGVLDMNVTAANDAPAFTAGATLSAINEDTSAPAGATITSLLSVNFSDVDTGNALAGIAVTASAANSGTEGKWQYSTDSGASWFDVGTVSTSSALLLNTTAMLRFLPVANFSGTPGALTVHAIDNSAATTFTSGATRQTFDTTTDDASSKVAASGVALGTSITAVNDAPTLTATGLNPTFAEGGSAVDLFGTVTASTVDAGQTFSALTLTVTNVSNGANEILAIGGTDVALVNGNAGTLTGIGNFSVTVASNTATVSASGMTRDNTQMAALVDGLTYRNAATSPEATARIITVTGIQDSGGTANSGVDSTSLALASTVTLDLAPTVTARSVPGDGAYKIGQHLDFTVTWSENVTVNTGGGTPYIALTLNTGGSVQAAYLSGSGTSTLTFRFTVASGNLDADGISLGSSITLNGGTIRDSSSTNAVTTSLGFGATAAVLVDGVVPTVSTINRQSPSGSTTNGTSVVYRVTFSESVTGVDTTDFTLTMTGTADGSIASISAVSGAVYDVTVNTITGSGVLRLNLNNSGTGIADSATNAIATGFTSGQTYTIDTTAPTVTSIGVPTNATYLANQNLDFTVNWTEVVTVDTSGGTPALALMIGATGRSATYLSGSGSTALMFRYTAQAGDADSDGITIGALSLNSGTLRDTAGNNATLTLNSVGSTANVLVDAVAPTISGATVPNNGTYKTGQDLAFTVSWSESVTVNTGGGTPYIALTLNTGGSVQAAYVSGSGSSTLSFRYTVASGNLDVDGIAVASSITLNGGTIREAVGNDAQLTSLGFAATTAVLVDAVVPTVSSIDRQTPSDAQTNATSVVYRVTFSETVSGVDTTDFTLTMTGTADGTIASVATVSSAVYDITVNTISGAGTLRLDLKNSGTGVADSATNAIASGFTSGQTYTLDATAPTVSAIARQAATTVHTDAASATWRVTFSENVTGVDSADFSLTAVSGSATGAVASVTPVSATVYDVAVNTLAGQGRLRLDLKNTGTGITDSAANAPAGGYTSGDFYVVGLPNVFETLNLSVVSNVSASLASTNKPAQRFTTDAASAATLSSLVVRLGAVTGTPAPVVTINADNAGTPGTVVATLTNPATLTANTLNAWTGNVALDAGTTYWVVFSETATAYSVVISTTTAGGSGVWLANPDYLFRYGANSGVTQTGALLLALGATTKPSITSSLSATGTEGTTFTYTTTASNVPTSYAATGLPAGLILNTTTGVITGTPTAAGTFNVALTATNGSGTGPTATLVITVGGSTDPDPTQTNPFNPGGTQTENNLQSGTGVVPTPAPADIITNLDQLANRVGISDNGVVVILDNGLNEPVKFRANPPDNVLIALPSQKPLDVQINGNTLNIITDPETPNPPKQTILGTTTLLLPDGTQAKGLQLVQGEAFIGNSEPGSTIGGMALSKDDTLRGLVVQAGPGGGTAGFRKTLDGAGSVSAESGEIRITVRLKGSGISTLRYAQALTLPGAFSAVAFAPITTATVTLILKAGEVARFNTLGELNGMFLGSLSGTAGKTGDLAPLIRPDNVAGYPTTTLIFDGGNTLGRLGTRFSNFMNTQVGGLQFSQRADGLLEIIGIDEEFYARTITGFEVVPSLPDGGTVNSDGSLSLIYGGIRSTYQLMLEDAGDFADFLGTSGYTLEVLDNGLVQVSDGNEGGFFVARPHHVRLARAGTTVTQGLSYPGPENFLLFYTNESGWQQRLDPAFRDEAQLGTAAIAEGWSVSHQGYGATNLYARSPTGQIFHLVPDLWVDILSEEDVHTGFRTEGQRHYFYYSDEPLRQGFTLQPVQ